MCPVLTWASTSAARQTEKPVVGAGAASHNGLGNQVNGGPAGPDPPARSWRGADAGFVSFGGLAVVARQQRAVDPRLCVPAFRRVCLYRVIRADIAVHSSYCQRTRTRRSGASRMYLVLSSISSFHRFRRFVRPILWFSAPVSRDASAPPTSTLYRPIGGQQGWVPQARTDLRIREERTPPVPSQDGQQRRRISA
jgi:hypothetical protein